MEPAARGLNEHLDLQDCSLEEYNESLAYVQEKDAIMDDDVFGHLKKITSYQYNQLYPGSTNRSDYATTRSLNREALKILVAGYEGYAWLCQTAAELFNALEEGELNNSDQLKDTPTLNDIIYKGLCEQLVTNYDTLLMRQFMDQKRDHGSWNPPDFYWQLMKNTFVASTMLKLYHEKPKDEFLACWYQDYVHNLNSSGNLSNLTSNFNVFTLRMSEEISKYLLKDVRTEFDEVNPDNICQLFCYAENAYFYSQALLHFIVRWRPDLSGCRRLSQLLCKNIMNPPPYWLDINKREKEYSASQINLLMTNLCKYKKLYKLFRSISQTQVDGKLILDSDEVCKLFDSLQYIVDSFESYQTLLYERPRLNSVVVQSYSNKNNNEKTYSTIINSNNSMSKIDPISNNIKNTDFLNTTENIYNSSNQIWDYNQNNSFSKSISFTKDQHNFGDLHNPEIDEIVDLPSASLYGGDQYFKEQYNRIRTAPEAPPMEALRESSLLDRLLEDFIDERISLTSNQAWTKYADLLILLTVHSPYEMLVKWEEDKKYEKAIKNRLQGVWKFELQSDEYDENFYEDDYFYSDGAEDSESEALLDGLFEEPEHHMPGSSFRDHTIQPGVDLSYNDLPRNSADDSKKRNYEYTQAAPKSIKRRWDSKFQVSFNPNKQDSFLNYSNSQEKLKKEISDYNHLDSNAIIKINKNSSSEIYSNPNKKNQSSYILSNSIFQQEYDCNLVPIQHSDKSSSDTSLEKLSVLFSEIQSDFNGSYSQSELSFKENYYGLGKCIRKNDQYISESDDNFQGSSSNFSSEEENDNIDPEFKSYSQSSSITSTYFEKSNKSKDESPIYQITKQPQNIIKSSNFQNEKFHYHINENFNNDSNSMISSSIFEDSLNNQKLGIDKQMSSKKSQKIKHLYQLFKMESSHYKKIARNELFQIYKITRDKFQSISQKMNTLRSLMSTNIAASAILKYIEYILLQESTDPLVSISDSIFLILKLIADRHSSQITAILLLLKAIFECGVNDIDSHLSNIHNTHRSKIINFFVYICRFENEYISVISIIQKLVDKMDKSMIRAFLLLLFEYCGPPYSSEFCRPLIKILSRCIELSILDWGDNQNSLEPKRVQKLVLQFLEEAQHCDHPSTTPQDILDEIHLLRNKFDDFK